MTISVKLRLFVLRQLNCHVPLLLHQFSVVKVSMYVEGRGVMAMCAMGMFMPGLIRFHALLKV